jgi:hypothetical protein
MQRFEEREEDAGLDLILQELLNLEGRGRACGLNASMAKCSDVMKMLSVRVVCDGTERWTFKCVYGAPSDHR